MSGHARGTRVPDGAGGMPCGSGHREIVMALHSPCIKIVGLTRCDYALETSRVSPEAPHDANQYFGYELVSA